MAWQLWVQSPAMSELVVAEKFRPALLRERVKEIGMHICSYDVGNWGNGATGRTQQPRAGSRVAAEFRSGGRWVN
jgi:hypothetical protein